MIRFARNLRLIPLVLLATSCLLLLKVSGLILDGGYTLGERLAQRGQPMLHVSTNEKVPDYPKIVLADGSQPKRSWAQEMFNFGGDPHDITGSTGESEPAAAADAGTPLKTSTKPPAPPKLDVAGNEYEMQPGQVNSPGERAILKRLRDRDRLLENRTRELDMRENLIKAAEKRVEARVEQLKDIKTHVDTVDENRAKAEQERFKSIVTMYENMKPKDAARIFDRLDLGILVQVVTLINPRKMSEILAQMKPETAERLTVELANRAGEVKGPQSADALPKIEGQPTVQ
ncbi:MAG TPA: flagellar protein FlbB [Pseudolabrys sp.]|jgi:flagellar motility protein MotE (MotC chaperone)|nr:flagellar protein FlbB [Pseudolabrys sp.]